MSEYSSSGVGLAESNTAAALEIDVDGRWDALALSEHLIRFHSFLVQYEAQRWVVHARTPGCHGEDLADALRAIDDWVAARGLASVSCRVDGRVQQLVGGERE
ncbi:MAG TPA: hypothetical protein VFU51_09525 [Gaiellaceae bacterium]|jgi:hypothetical protein|nr:hypothetical protein [Gaiellaceae bacterium]